MILFKHPDDVCMSYTQHCKLSIKLALLMLLGSIKRQTFYSCFYS